MEEDGDDGNDDEDDDDDDDDDDGDDGDWEKEDGYLKDFNIMRTSPFWYTSLVFFDDDDVIPAQKN